MADSRSSLSGLTENEARAFHSAFVSSTLGYTVIAVIAHFLVWQWRPWF
jgi:light-harvesting complex 1 beta chain